MLRQGNPSKQRYYERFQVGDVINFFSGQLLHAKSADGAQVFLQSIKLPHHPLPIGYQDMLRKLQHPYLAPILDVLEEEDRIILVHPPFLGDPLPLMVKDHPMAPERAVRLVSRLFRTLNDLERLPLSMRASLDPKNILLNGQTPLLLFYYIKDQEETLDDEKWRELLFYLLTGKPPVKDLRENLKALQAKQIPHRLIQVAFRCMDSNVSYRQAMESLERYIGLTETTRVRPQNTRRVWYALAAIVVTAGIFISLVTSPTHTTGSTEKKFDNIFHSQDASHVIAHSEADQSIQFTDAKTDYTMPEVFQDATVVHGEFLMKQSNLFTTVVESTRGTDAYGISVDTTGRINLFRADGRSFYSMGNSGKFRLKVGKKYSFDIYYLPEQPLRISVTDENGSDKWMVVGNMLSDKTYQVRFRGYKGTVLFAPQLHAITDMQSVDTAWMGQQPWQLVVGQGMLSVDANLNNLFDVSGPNPIVRVKATDTNKVAFLPTNDLPTISLEAVDGSRYNFELNKQKISLSRVDSGFQKVGDQPFKWVLSNDPIWVSVANTGNQLTVTFTQGETSTVFQYTNSSPVVIENIDLFVKPNKELILFNNQE